MSAQPKHTPVPWTSETRFGHTSDGSPRQVITAESVDRIAVMSLRGAAESDLSNARYIVQACNSHADLLEACAALLAADDEHTRYYENIPDGCTADPAHATRLTQADNRARKALRAAIAKAKGDPS